MLASSQWSGKAGFMIQRLLRASGVIANKIEWKDVQGTDKYSCGNYRDHSLFSAKEWSKKILEEGISNDPYERHVI